MNSINKNNKEDSITVLIVTSVGTGLRYFFHTGIIANLIKSGIKVVALVPNSNKVENDLKLSLPSVQLSDLSMCQHTSKSGWLYSTLVTIMESTVQYLRMAGVSNKMNRSVFRDVQTHQNRQWNHTKFRFLLPIWNLLASILQRSQISRQIFRKFASARPIKSLGYDPFTQYRPSLVVTNSPGWWPGEEVIIREASKRGVPSTAILVGWDHTASQGLPLAMPDRIRTWSEIQKNELVDGCDVSAKSIDVGGVAYFDHYKKSEPPMSCKEYLVQNGLDPSKKLISFGCTFVGISSNVGIVQALAQAIAQDKFNHPSQLLIRLHPSHFKKPRNDSIESDLQTLKEVEIYKDIARSIPDVHINTPDFSTDAVANATTKNDMINVSSLLKYSDVFVTLFSTMVLEAALNDTPIVSVAIDPPSEWKEGRLMSIMDALDWPTHERIVDSNTSIVAMNYDEMIKGINTYVDNPKLHSKQRRDFAIQECTYIDGNSADRIAQYISDLATSNSLT